MGGDKPARREEPAVTHPTDDAHAHELAGELGHEDGIRRQRARHHLVFLGSASVPALVRALRSPDRTVRWEAAKALVGLRDPRALEALGHALADEDDGVSWLAAMALIELGRPGLEAALRAVTQHPSSYNVGVGAHHVMHELGKKGYAEILAPAMRALESMERESAAPGACERALEALEALDA